jgi:phage gpG-like protein
VVDAITITAVGLDEALFAINALPERVQRGEGLEILGALVESQTEARFNTAIDPYGDPWAPWSPTYAKSRRKGQSILVASGALRDSIAWVREGDEVSIGSNLVYAAVQQFGSKTGENSGHQVKAHTRLYRSEFDGPNERTYGAVLAHTRVGATPAREYLGLSDADIVECNEAIADWVGSLLH